MRTVGQALLVGIMAFAVATGLVRVAEAQPPIRIGATYAQTGSLAAMGQNQRRGAQLCVKHANNNGGVLGRRVELLAEDDQSSGNVAAGLYERLITRDKADAVLGPYSSPSPRPLPT
jgi:branched-chain amino acid transport system substrate-binding protein